MILLVRIVQIGLGLSIGIFAIFWTAGEMERLNASVTLGELILGTIVFALAYLGIALFALRDVRASGLLICPLVALSTPLYVLLWLFSQWTPQSSQKAVPLLWGIAANIVLLATGITGILMSPVPARPEQQEP